MKTVRLESSSLLTKRARGLRWRSKSWRIRNGEVFVAHFEAELIERNRLLTRSCGNMRE